MSLNPKILITDAIGMLGFQLIKDLIKKGENLRVLRFQSEDVSHLEKYKNNLEIIDADLLDISLLEDALQGIEQVFHCKELVSFHPQDEQKLFDINIVGTRNIVNVALSLAVKKVVFVSSTLAFGNYVFKKKITEKTKWIEHDDNTIYSISKHHAELEIHRGQEEGLETIIVNSSIIIGDSLNENDLYNFNNMAKKQYRFYPKGKNGFVKLEDVSKACVLLMKSNISNEKFILSAENLSYHSVLEKINPALAKKNIFSRTNKTKLNLNWRINKMKSFLFDARPFLSEEIYGFNDKVFEFENTKITEVINFNFSNILD